MRKSFIFCSLFIFYFLFGSTICKSQSLIGDWLSFEKNKKEQFIHFDSSGYALIISGKDSVGGKEFVKKGFKGTMKFEFDSSQTPKAIDFVLYVYLEANKPQEMGRLLGIFEFLTPDRIRMKVSFKPNYRPTTLEYVNEEENLMVLDRVTKKQTK